MTEAPAHPVLKKARSLYLTVWLIPLCAAIGAGFYFRDYLELRGPVITIRFSAADGIKVGDTPVLHRGVRIGKVTDVELSENLNDAEVTVRLERHQEAFAKKGADFWIVRPEISEGGLTGLNTVLTGPYIDSVPAPREGLRESEIQSEFIGLGKSPESFGDGVSLILHERRLDHLQAGSPIFYRGIQVGAVRGVKLGRQGDWVDVDAVVWSRYRALVKTNSRFWNMSGFDVKAGLFSGVELKLRSLQTILNGGVGFATPEAQDAGAEAKDRAEFTLESEPKKQWLDWAPKIELFKDFKER
jgi:paraquat-inducible protein B